MKTLSVELSHALEQELSTQTLKTLQHASQDLTHRYAEGRAIAHSSHRYAYLATRFPATYGVACHLLSLLEESSRESLHTLLDLGSGAGSMVWAAQRILPHLEAVTCIEQDRALIALGKKLAASAPSFPSLTWYQKNLTLCSSFSPHDLVMLSYVLNELPPSEQAILVERAYKAARKCLVVIEPGTPQGFASLLRTRALLLEKGAHILAPCPHHAPCPLTRASQEGTDWCHFSERIPRERFHKHVKKASLPYEDEKYTYLIVSPSSTPPLAQNRIIKAPIKRSGHVLLDLCTPEGSLARKIISKKDKIAYTKARLCSWGEAFED